MGSKRKDRKRKARRRKNTGSAWSTRGRIETSQGKKTGYGRNDQPQSAAEGRGRESSTRKNIWGARGRMEEGRVGGRGTRNNGLNVEGWAATSRRYNTGSARQDQRQSASSVYLPPNTQHARTQHVDHYHCHCPWQQNTAWRKLQTKYLD